MKRQDRISSTNTEYYCYSSFVFFLRPQAGDSRDMTDHSKDGDKLAIPTPMASSCPRLRHARIHWQHPHGCCCGSFEGVAKIGAETSLFQLPTILLAELEKLTLLEDSLSCNLHPKGKDIERESLVCQRRISPSHFTFTFSLHIRLGARPDRIVPNGGAQESERIS
jgi:hypothetical protein